MSILSELQDDYSRADNLLHGLMEYATGGTFDESDYIELRSYFKDHPEFEPLLPSWIVSKRSVRQFWEFIKHKFPTYAERREFLYNEFEPLLARCESGSRTPSEDDITATLTSFDGDGVHRAWKRILFRLPEDPEGAITLSRTLIESVCKHILDDRKVAYDPKKIDLPTLYKLTASELNLSPDQHNEQVFRQILSGCKNVVNGLGSIRNRLGDAHGHGKTQVRPSQRHARLASNLAGAMALYLIETYNTISS